MDWRTAASHALLDRAVPVLKQAMSDRCARVVRAAAPPPDAAFSHGFDFGRAKGELRTAVTLIDRPALSEDILRRASRDTSKVADLDELLGLTSVPQRPGRFVRELQRSAVQQRASTLALLDDVDQQVDALRSHWQHAGNGVLKLTIPEWRAIRDLRSALREALDGAAALVPAAAMREWRARVEVLVGRSDASQAERLGAAQSISSSLRRALGAQRTIAAVPA